MDWLLTLDIGGTKIDALRVDMDLRPLGDAGRSPTVDSVDALRAYLRDLANNSFGGLAGLRGVAVSVAGSVDSDAGRVFCSPNADWLDGLELQREIERELAVPAAIENDANAFALAEAQLGAGAGRQHLVGITLGTGVGGGMVIDGRIHHGSGIGAGELGHTSINLDGPECTCGSTGCIEAYIGGWAIPRTAMRLFESYRGPTELEGVALSGQDLYQAQIAGDPFANLFWAQYGLWLGVALANWINLLRPEAVIFGGSGAQALPLFRDQMLQTAGERVLPPLFDGLHVAAAECEWPGNLGAALMLLDRLGRRPRPEADT